MSVALITGATGQVGSHIAERLLADGWTVRALVRSPERARQVLDERVQLSRGDVLDEASFCAAADGCHTVFHAAANIIVSGGWEAYRATNVEGTRNAILAAQRAGARLLHVSSVAVYGNTARYEAARGGGRTDESTVLPPLSPRAYYARSKRESEEMVLRAHVEGRVWATAVRPDVIYGRRDRQFVPRVARLLRLGVFPLMRDGRSTMTVVHAANVAEGAVLAATSDIAGGKAYNLANDYDVTVRQFFEFAGRGLGRPPVFVPVPMWVARGGVRGLKAITRLLTGGRFSLLSTSSVDFLSEDNPFSSDLAKRELGWRPSVRPEEGVVDAFRWFRSHAAG
ncbi:MAG: NAD-dependent epimerase/dehydratase family protein [Gemmatimonadaceae bacterium]